jgi:aminoglycoside phosphotransferase (APT) family kinase protein
MTLADRPGAQPHSSAPADAPFTNFLTRNELVSDTATLSCRPLGGGVSSDIWLVGDGDDHLVVKRPLAELKVADDWHAPLERGASEAAYLMEVGRLVPGACPKVLAFDADEHWLALEFLDPASHVLWKDELLAGRVDSEFARRLGGRLGSIHRLTASRPGLAHRFATDDLFRALRLEPYFVRLAQTYPLLADPIDALVRRTANTRHVVVHGDVSPKNIMRGPKGPVLLDAETAWWGDPAFDLAFCVNHLLLKTLRPNAPAAALLQATGALVGGYLPHIVWERPVCLLRRVARLLPALLLARVDGRSPVEYLTEPNREHVRAFAVPLVLQPPSDLPDLIHAWKESLR